MGASEIDSGGYGIADADLLPGELNALFEVGEMPGYTVSRLGDLAGVKDPSRPLLPTVPFTHLPDSFFQPEVGWLLHRAGGAILSTSRLGK